MLLFLGSGGELLLIILSILFFLGIFVFVIIMVIKILKRLFAKKTDSKNSTSDNIAQLERLATLKQKGLLTDAEYEREKNKLL